MISHAHVWRNKRQAYVRLVECCTKLQPLLWHALCSCCRGRSREGRLGDRPPPKTYESNLIHHDFVQFEKQHSRYKAIFALHCFVTTVLWRKLHLSYGSEPVMRLDCQILLKLPLLTLLAGSAPEPSLCRFVSNVAHNCSRCYRNLLRLIYCAIYCDWFAWCVVTAVIYYFAKWWRQAWIVLQKDGGPGRRFPQTDGWKDRACFVDSDTRRQIPTTGVFHHSWHQLKKTLWSKERLMDCCFKC